MPGQNQYSVYDIKACKYILRDKSNNVIEKTIGIPKERASRYAKHAILYKDRYRIISKQEIEFMEEWDRVRFMINPNAKRY